MGSMVTHHNIHTLSHTERNTLRERENHMHTYRERERERERGREGERRLCVYRCVRE